MEKVNFRVGETEKMAKFLIFFIHLELMQCTKRLVKKSIPREQPNQNKEMKIADSVLLSLFMRDK